MNKTGNKTSLALITGVASLGGLLFGFDMAVISGVLPLIEKQFSLSSAAEGWFVASALVGCIFGVAISGELTDKFGRKKLLILSAVLFLAAALGCALLPFNGLLIAARVAGGIAVGIASNIVPLYISEIAPARIRGRLVTYYQFAVTIGILIAYLTNAGLLNFSLSHAAVSSHSLLDKLFIDEVWRGMFGLATLPALLFLLGLLLVPESPRWLIQKGRKEEALQVLHAMGNEDVALYAEGTAKASDSKKGSYKDLFAPSMRRALMIGLLLPFFSQFSGINAIIYYGPTILNNAGITLSNSLLSQVLFGAANVLFTIIAIWKVDGLGRRPLYLAGTAGAAISLILTGICFYTGATSSIWLLICVLVFLACFAFSIGPLKFVIAAEIFPNHIRGRAMALSIMVMWVADTIVGQLTPILLRSIGTAWTFFIFGFFCLVAFGVVYKILPETKGKSLEEIEGSWGH